MSPNEEGNKTIAEDVVIRLDMNAFEVLTQYLSNAWLIITKVDTLTLYRDDYEEYKDKYKKHPLVQEYTDIEERFRWPSLKDHAYPGVEDSIDKLIKTYQNRSGQLVKLGLPVFIEETISFEKFTELIHMIKAIHQFSQNIIDKFDSKVNDIDSIVNTIETSIKLLAQYNVSATLVFDDEQPRNQFAVSLLTWNETYRYAHQVVTQTPSLIGLIKKIETYNGINRKII